MRLPDEPEIPPQINIVPMIDVIFAILTFFIMSTLFLTRSEGLSVNLPQAKSAKAQPSAPITITIDAHARSLHLHVSDEELTRRRTQWKPPQPRYTTGVLAKYAKLVSSSSLGAVTDLDLG